MTHTIETHAVTVDDVVDKVRAMKDMGHRLVAVTSLDIDEETNEILYHFDKDLKMTHFRLRVGKGKTVPSISGVYFCAFLVENEIRDQYGVCFEGIALDFEGKLYLDEEVQTTPFCKYGVTQKVQ
jgi:ech hydrogenase subunit D